MAVRPQGGFIRKPRYFQNVDKASESQPFTGGVVTDRYPWELAPGESPFLQDCIWPKGVACLRGNWARVGDIDPFAAAVAPFGVAAVNFPSSPAVVDLVLGGVGQLVRATSGNAGIASHADLAVYYATDPIIPRCVYQGEVLSFDFGGLKPFLRSANHFASIPVSLTGTFSVGADSVVATGAATAFTTDAPALTYLAPFHGGFGVIFPPLYRVGKVTSNTELSIVDPIFGTPFSGMVAERSSIGVAGLRCLVQDTGTVDVTAAGVVTGHGTTFLNAGFNQLPGSDLVLPKATYVMDGLYYTGLPQTNAAWLRTFVTTRTTDTAIQLTGTATMTVATAARFFAHRALVGRDGCVHQQALFVTGCAWKPRRVFMLPPGARLAEVHNQVDPLWSGNDFLAKWMDVPATDTGGRIEAVLSGGDTGPLLVLATEAAFAVTTLYPPSPSNTTIRNVGPGLGCCDLRSAVSSEFGQFWAGTEAIAGFRRGQIVNLTEGRRGREWRALMKARSSTARVWAAVVNGHLIVGLNDPAGPTNVVWCYDLIHDVWTGNITTMGANAAWSSRPVAGSQEAHIALSITSGARVGAIGSAFLDEGAAAGANQGSFIAETPANVGGDPTLLKRVTDMKVGYELVGGGATLTVKTSDGFAAAGTERALAAGSAGQFLTERVRPITDVTQSPAGYLGRQVRQFKVRLEGGGSPSALRVHELNVETRYLQGPRS